MKRERDEEMKSGRGQAPSIFFFDLSEMGTGLGLLYSVGILGSFGLIFYVLINKLFTKPVDFTKQKKADRGSKKHSNKSSGSNSKKTQ